MKTQNKTFIFCITCNKLSIFMMFPKYLYTNSVYSFVLPNFSFFLNVVFFWKFRSVFLRQHCHFRLCYDRDYFIYVCNVIMLVIYVLILFFFLSHVDFCLFSFFVVHYVWFIEIWKQVKNYYCYDFVSTGIAIVIERIKKSIILFFLNIVEIKKQI